MLTKSLSEPAGITTTKKNQATQYGNVRQSSLQLHDPTPHNIREIHSTDFHTTVVVSPSPPALSSHPKEQNDGSGPRDKLSIEQPLFPYLDTQNLAEDERHALYGRLTNEYKSITSSYARLNKDIRKSLQERDVSPSQLADELMELSAFPLKVKDSSKPLLEDCFDEIETVKSIQGVFKILRPYGSFFDCHIIKHIVNSELCTDEDRNKLHGYLSELDDYCRRNVFECQHFASEDPKFPKLILKVDSLVSTNFSMKSLDAFSVDVAKNLGLSRHTLRVCSVDEGCIQLTYQIPQCAMDKIFPLTPEQEGALRSLGVLSLTCEGGQKWEYNLSAPQAQKSKVNAFSIQVYHGMHESCVLAKINYKSIRYDGRPP